MTAGRVAYRLAFLLYHYLYEIYCSVVCRVLKHCLRTMKSKLRVVVHCRNAEWSLLGTTGVLLVIGRGCF